MKQAFISSSLFRLRSRILSVKYFSSTVTHGKHSNHQCRLLDRIVSSEFSKELAIIDPVTKLSYTYEQLEQYSNKLAQDLIDRNYHQKVAALGCLNHSPSSFVISMLATWKIGKVFVPLSVSHSAHELSYFIQDSNIGGILCYNQNDLDKQKLDALATQFFEVQPTLSAPEGKKEHVRLPTPNDALILYTSGTTGKPKGVVHTHDSIEHMVKSLVEAWKYNSKDKILHFLPLYHMHGLCNKLLCMLWSGGTIEFLPSAKAGAIWKRLAQETSTTSILHNKPLSLFMGVPTVYAKMLEHSKKMDAKEKEDGIKTMKSLRLMVCGSAALPDVIMDEWKAMTGQTLLERYGMTELGMALSNPLEGERRKGYVGFPMPYVTVRIVDEQGNVINSPNTPGELQVSVSANPSLFINPRFMCAFLSC
jgi:malonyl-CoA/methylmalonyl-CoA synthetase